MKKDMRSGKGGKKWIDGKLMRKVKNEKMKDLIKGIERVKKNKIERKKIVEWEEDERGIDKRKGEI